MHSVTQFLRTNQEEIRRKRINAKLESSLNNQQKTKIKKHFIELVKVLEEYDFIESKYKIISNGSFHDVQELTIKNIHEGFVIYEKLSI